MEGATAASSDGKLTIMRREEDRAIEVSAEGYNYEREEQNYRQSNRGGVSYRAESAYLNKRGQTSKGWSKRRRGGTRRLQPSNGHLQFEGRDYPLLEYTDYLKAQMEIEEHFNKKFCFNKSSGGEGSGVWTLPPAETMFTKPVWQDEELQASKAALNKVKEKLTDKDVGEWHVHTRNTNPAEKIAYTARRRASPEMVTQAWLKFFEILNAYPVVPYGEGEENANIPALPFNSVHVCEAPGAFIVALNHYLGMNRPSIKWQWLGNTLNPYFEGSPADLCVVEDKLIFLTLDKWSFGVDNTGDLMKMSNLEDIIQRSENMGPIHLVTADGSVDCQTDPANQEITTHGLHFCEVVTALSVLAPGGSLVVKKFTMFESGTINMMYLLCCVFEEVHIHKPGASKEGNSEVYAICMKYCGKEMCAAHLKKLVENYGICNSNVAMFSLEDLPSEFLLQLRKCTEVFKSYQIKTISKNLALFKKINEQEQQYIDLLKYKANAMYFEQSNCEKINRACTLTDGKVNKSRYLLATDLNKPITSSLVRTKCPSKKLPLLKKYMDMYIKELSKKNWNIDLLKGDCCDVSRLPTEDLVNIPIEVIRGKPFHFIKASKFCSPRVQEVFREYWVLWESIDDHPDFDINDSLMKHVVLDYPEADILKTEVTAGPVGQLGALKEALLKLREGNMSNGSSMILSNVTLLSRLQCGVLFLLGSAFHNIVFYTSKELGANAPVIVMENFKSVDIGLTVVDAMLKSGWNAYDEEADSSEILLQVVSFSTLLENLKLSNIYHYNIHHIIHRSFMLQMALHNKLHIKCEEEN